MNTQFNQKTLSLFNVVIGKESRDSAEFLYEEGLIVDSHALWAMSDIQSYINQVQLSGQDLNKTFHKSWAKVQNSSRLELAIEQIQHYISTYGSDFQDEIYIPNEVLNVPDVKLKLRTIRGVSKSFISIEALKILESGIALKEETLKDIFFILDEIGYVFDGSEKIKNKEAIILIANKYNIYPESPEEFLRYLVWYYTESTLLIKTKDILNQIAYSGRSVDDKMLDFGLEKLATIFNRFKPLFLAMRKASHKNKTVINKISKLSKTLHVPMVQNALNLVTQKKLMADDMHWLDNATPYALLKALEACYNRKHGQSTFVYRIRNGKSWVKEGKSNLEICSYNFDIILDFLKSKFDGRQQKVFIPEHIQYAVPTSEKMMVGNIPTGTKVFGESLAAGVYWRDSWGANDIDISAVSFGGKIGWNSDYSNEHNTVTYSGDITSAPNGAVEYLWAKGNFEPTLVMSNIYSGRDDAGYHVVVGNGHNVTRDYMMDPNNVILEIKTKSVQKQTVVGLLMNEGDNLSSFTLMNFGAGTFAVSGAGYLATLTSKALSEVMSNSFCFNYLLEQLNYDVVNKKDEFDEFVINLDPKELTKTSFLDFFES